MENKKYSERLAQENAALLLIDHQIGLFTGVRDIPVAELTHNVIGLAKAARVLGLPIIVTATSPEMWGPTIAELTQALPGISIINRTTVNAFDEPRFARAVEAAGRVVRCQVRGTIEPLLRVLAASDVRQLISREPSLEELFLELMASRASDRANSACSAAIFLPPAPKSAPPPSVPARPATPPASAKPAPGAPNGKTAPPSKAG